MKVLISLVFSFAFSEKDLCRANIQSQTLHSPPRCFGIIKSRCVILYNRHKTSGEDCTIKPQLHQRSVFEHINLQKNPPFFLDSREGNFHFIPDVFNKKELYSCNTELVKHPLDLIPPKQKHFYN